MLFVIDFDGTVAPDDTVDALLEHFADPDWRLVEQQWVRGEINSQQCMAAQLGMVRTDRKVVEEFLQSTKIDPAFPEFVRFVREFAEIAVVSDGLDYTIFHALRSLAPPAPIYANRLEFLTRGLGISFPYAEASCKVQSGVCKCAVAKRVSGGEGAIVLVGDGRSDLCIAREADYVFAKASLRRYCEAEEIVHTPFETFDDVLSIVRTWNISGHEGVHRRLNAPWSDVI